MIDQETRGRILALIHKEVVPAIGCMEPMAVALCTARAVEQLGCKPEKIEALLAMEGKCVTSQEGIVDDDIDRSIHNLTAIGADAMCITDEMVLNIMTSKGC
jgi:L-cysteine desulfidase